MPTPSLLPPPSTDIMEILDRNNEDFSGRKWQDEINSGFDRLVAYATEVDKRRKSTDSSGSPVRPNSGLSGHEDLNFPGKDIIDDVFDGSRNFQKFGAKSATGSCTGSGSGSITGSNNMNSAAAAAAQMQNSSNPSGNIYSSGPRGVVSANSPYARTIPKNASSTKSYVPSALASVGSLDDLTSGPSPEITSTPSPRSKSRQILPGENLPEHHFKKRYFAENQAPPIVATPTSSKNGSPPLSSSPS